VLRELCRAAPEGLRSGARRHAATHPTPLSPHLPPRLRPAV